MAVKELIKTETGQRGGGRSLLTLNPTKLLGGTLFSNPPTLQGRGSSGTPNTAERIPLGSFQGSTLREAAPKRGTLQNEFP